MTGIPEEVPDRTVTFRAGSSTPVFLGMVSVCVVLLGDAAIRGRWDVVITALPAVGVVVWAAVAVYAMPCLRLSDTGLSVVNILRTTDAPWGEVADVTTRHQVVVTLKDGSRIRCWGAPTSARSRPAGRDVDARRGDSGRRMTGSSAHRMIADTWSGHAGDEPGTGEITRTWHTWSIATGGTLLAVVLVQLAVALLR